jgi:kinesin family protein 18/19
VELGCEAEGKKPEMLHRSREHRYYFDRIFPIGTDTETVYQNTCANLLDSVIQGYNACVFAYGTTGSGKTFTMCGYSDSPGINYYIIRGIFEKIQNELDKRFEIKASYVEIYNEVIRDLLVANSKETFLDLRDDPEKGVCIAGVTEFEVQEP